MGDFPELGQAITYPARDDHHFHFIDPAMPIDKVGKNQKQR
jgi:hypothetical protein